MTLVYVAQDWQDLRVDMIQVGDRLGVVSEGNMEYWMVLDHFRIASGSLMDDGFVRDIPRIPNQRQVL